MTEQPKRGRGRPAFAPTKTMRENVAIWRAGGMTNQQIADALDIDYKTLEKHFQHELSVGWSKKRAQMLTALFKAGVTGNVSAQKHYLQISGVTAGIEKLTAPEDKKPKGRPLGKKEQAEAAAQTAGQGSDWGEDLAAAVAAGRG